MSVNQWPNGSVECGTPLYIHWVPYPKKNLVIQYHEKVKGVQGDFSGIRIANETHCQIDRKQNPNGMCRKQVTAHQKNDALASSSVSKYPNSLKV